MIRAEFRRILNVPAVRFWLGLLAVLAILECGEIILQYQNVVFRSEAAVEERRQTEYEYTMPARIGENLDQLQSRQNSILFSDADKQAELRREIENLEALKENTSVIRHTDIFKRVLSFIPTWSAVYLLTGILLTYYLFLQDDTAKMQMLYASAAQSRSVQARSKLIVLGTFLLVPAVIKTAAECVLLHFCGFSGGIPIQAVNGFFSPEINASLAGYMMILNSRAVIAAVLTILLFVFLYYSTGQWNVSAGILLLFCTIEYLICTFVSAASSFSFLKHINLYEGMFSAQLQNGYTILFGMPFSRTGLFILLMCVLCLVISAGILFRFRKPAGIRQKRKRRTLRAPHTAAGFHIREVFLRRKGIAVLFMLAVFCTGSALHYDAVQTADELRYEAFRRTYYGPLNEALLNRIEHDRQMTLEAVKKRNEYIGRLNELTDAEAEELEELSETASQAENIETVYAEVCELYNAGARVYVNHSGLQYLMRKDDRSGSVLDFVTAVFPAGLLAIAVMASLQKGAAAEMIESSAAGKKAVLQSYAKILTVFLLLTIVTVYGAQALRVMSAYPLNLSGTIDEAVSIAGRMPVKLYVFLHYVHVILLGIAFVLSAEHTSGRLPFASALIFWTICAVIAAGMPFVSSYIGFDYARHFYAYAGFSLFLAAADLFLYKKL